MTKTKAQAGAPEHELVLIVILANVCLQPNLCGKTLGMFKQQPISYLKGAKTFWDPKR